MSLEEFNVEEYTELIKEDSYNQGKADGKAEGKAEGLKTVAEHMHSRGDDLSYIADTLNVSIEQVKEWVGSTPS